MRRDKIMLMGRVFLIVTPFMFFANLRETISPSRVDLADKETRSCLVNFWEIW